MVDDPTKTEIEDAGNRDRAGRILVFWDGGSASRELPKHGSVSFGRSTECDIPIEHASVSRRHAILHVDGELRIEDLGSSNGTRISGTRVSARIPTLLGPGDVVEIGGARVLIEHPKVVVPARPSGPPPAVAAEDEAMLGAYRLLELVAPSHLNILIYGETGVGKELAAQAVHRRSPRAKGPFVRINCAALPEPLVESELFGYEKGAFTGANAQKLGLLESADGGTVFLDEVAELPLGAQAKLLRAIESREIVRIGALVPKPIDVRFVAATHADLSARVGSGTFREDLFFRLNGASVTIPPLRERQSEIVSLANSFLTHASESMGVREPSFTPEAMAVLLGHSWPGNIRELKNVVERAVAVSGGAPIAPEHLPPELLGPVLSERTPRSTPLRAELDAVERRRILDALERCGGHQGRAAELLGISRRTLLSRLDAHGLPRPRKGQGPAKR
jgi:two-component system, NtrC family, response regulator AtoC